MQIVSHQVGIDVAKDELVVCLDGGKPFVVANTQEGCLELLDRLPCGSQIHLEASGGYERLVRRMLGEGGLKVVVYNPVNARFMAKAKGRKAKTDFIDAKFLCQAGALLPEPSSKSLERQQIGDHSRAIEALKGSVADFKKRMKAPELDEIAQQIYKGAVEDIEKRIAAATKLFEKRIKRSSYAGPYIWICSVPALGPNTARICICEFPEDVLDQAAGRISSYAGMAPFDDQSGNKTRPARIGRGNHRLKKAFYMPAICAIRTQDWARELYARLRARGLTHQGAIVAVMRRLLLRAVAVIKRGSTWQVEPQKP